MQYIALIDTKKINFKCRQKYISKNDGNYSFWQI